MSMITCKYCDRGIDTDYDAEHEEMCRVEHVWDEILTLLISLKTKEMISLKEYKIMKDDFELVVNDFQGE